MNTGATVVLEDLSRDERVAQPQVRLGTIGPAVFLPLGSPDHTIGSLSVVASDGERSVHLPRRRTAAAVRDASKHRDRAGSSSRRPAPFVVARRSGTHRARSSRHGDPAPLRDGALVAGSDEARVRRRGEAPDRGRHRRARYGRAAHPDGHLRRRDEPNRYRISPPGGPRHRAAKRRERSGSDPK